MGWVRASAWAWVVAGAIGCATPHRAVRLEPPRFDDAELRADLQLTAPSRVRLALYNRSDGPVAVRWDELTIVAGHRLLPMPVRGVPGELAPGARVEVQLAPLETRPDAWLELIVPTVVRGVAREYHYHVRTRS